MFLKSDDADILIQSFGPAGRSFVAQGGWVGSGELWLPVLEGLSDTWRAVSFDHRGTGATRSRSPSITFDALVDDVFAVMDACGIQRCVVAGESAGAAVAVEAALRRPERVSALVLVAARLSGRIDPGTAMLRQGCLADFPRTMERFVRHCTPEAGVDAEREWGRRIVMRSDAKAAVELLDCMADVDHGPRLAELRMPVLMLHGAKDAICPLEQARDWASRIDGAVLKVCDDAGHVPTITRPEWVIDEIRRFADNLNVA